MRASAKRNGISVRAIAGNHVVMLGMDATARARSGLLGFAIYRNDHTSGVDGWLSGSLTFEALAHTHRAGEDIADPRDHPIQDFRWSDFQAEPGHRYTYEIHAVYGSPGKTKLAEPVTVEVTTEPVHQRGDSVFFNRGVAGSQGYLRRFGDQRPDDVADGEALRWLSRGLEEGLLAFIGEAADERFKLRASLYEFSYMPVLRAFKSAAKRGADVKVIFDYKHPDGEPGKENMKAIKQAGIRRLTIPRTNFKSAISHNKFIVLLERDRPVAVWTGSTNVTEGAIFGHSNVGHLIRDPQLAATYMAYWEALEGDPSGKDLRQTNEKISPLDADSLHHQPIFSPRSSLDALDTYAEMMDRSAGPVFLTAAFGISDELRDVLVKQKTYLRYVLMDNTGQKGNRQNYRDARKVKNNRIALGDVVRADGELDNWHQERLTGLNDHVKYVHTKYMLIDPFGPDETLITGSANFSEASTTKNDENMVIVRSCPGVVDVYLTEFMRLFSHFEFRNKLNASYDKKKSRFAKYLVPDQSWTNRFFVEGSADAQEREFFSGSEPARRGRGKGAPAPKSKRAPKRRGRSAA